MTGSLPAAVKSVFDRFITTELTTIKRAGQPITWPVTPDPTGAEPQLYRSHMEEVRSGH